VDADVSICVKEALVPPPPSPLLREALLVGAEVADASRADVITTKSSPSLRIHKRALPTAVHIPSWVTMVTLSPYDGNGAKPRSSFNPQVAVLPSEPFLFKKKKRISV